MKWNWELANWPNFKFDQTKIAKLEKKFLLNVGESIAVLKSISSEDRKQFIVEILSQEGVKSSKIEGEILQRESLQSSIKKHFGLKNSDNRKFPKETGMAELLCDIYDNFSLPLTHEMLFKWHDMLFDGSTNDIEYGRYRSHDEPMQIVSHRYDNHRVFFEAPPSSRVYEEMQMFIDWFNATNSSESIFIRAAVAHVYFESIHPFEDGNGRIGRALVEKVLSQGVGKSILITISAVLEKNKKEYYLELGKCNNTLDVQEWIDFFSNVILTAQQASMDLLNFLIEKSKMLLRLSGALNSRQEKVLLRMFEAGIEGFKGGLSADNYIKITKTSRATATRDLADLVKKGALVKVGELRHTRYSLNITKSQNHF